MKEKTRRVIIVLGMHRSGTSALAGVLGLLGLRLPARLMIANFANSKGYFEPEYIVAIHDRILASAGTTWAGWEEIPEAWFLSEACRAFVDELAEAINEDYGAAQIFVVKDPRMCRLMPLWYRVLDRIDVKPYFAIPLRNPVEVAKSLQNRDGLPLAHGCLLWLRHVLDAEHHSRGRPRVFLRYGDLLAKPRPVINRMKTSLGVTWPRQIKSILGEIEDFLDPSLRTQIAHERDIDDMGDFSPWLRQTYECYEALVHSPNDRVAIRRLDSLQAAFAASDAAFTPVFKHQAEQNASELAALRETLTARQKEIHTLGERLAERETQIAAFNQALAEREAQVATLDRALAERETQIAAFNQALAEREAQVATLDRALAERETQIAALDQARVERETQIGNLSYSLAERDRSIAKLRGELAAHEQSLLQLKNEYVRLNNVATATSQRLNLIEISTTWQASLPVRRTLAGLPTPIRRGGRQALKGLWWFLTPHRIPARLRDLRARRSKPPSS